MLLIKRELVENIDSIDGLQAALQAAIELEHATIPPYLYALYSLGADNTEIAGRIHTVVIEEMAHFTLAANILNAIGGAPCIDKPGFVPTYPGPLPWTVEEPLCVPLEPFSLDNTEKVFMQIECPEDPLAIRKGLTADGPLTIGTFYHRILTSIQALENSQPAGKTIFTGDPAYQIAQDLPSLNTFPVYRLDDVENAINIIVCQGEGSPHSPYELLPGGKRELAHYYRFGEIVHLHPLVSDGKVPPDWSYTGDPPIPFDPSKVAHVIANPKTADYPAGSAARYGCETFNYTYTSLLKVLHEAFNGNPSRLDAAIGMMLSLKEQALTLAAIDSGDGGKAGPSFEYQPTNPARDWKTGAPMTDAAIGAQTRPIS